MRTVMIASAGLMLAAVAGGAAAQQRAGATYPVPGRVPAARPAVRAVPAPTVGPATRAAVTPIARPVPAGPRQARWGSKIGGRWWGGANAPGGWNAYRRPARGWALPAYWVAPRFAIGDWSGYGLPTPPTGYRWTRYYDDAVLIDPRGSVYDTVSDIAWDRSEPGGYPTLAPQDYAQNDSVYAGPDDRGYAARRDGRSSRRDPRRDTGLGGAAIGAAAGGVAGNIIAGRGNRLGGTLIGAGVGAVAGYAIDKAEDRGRRAPPPRGDYGASYPPPVSYGAAYPQPRDYAVAPSGTWVSPDGMTTVTTTGGSVYPAGASTVIVQSAPMVTTTTTEYYDTVSYAPQKTWRKRVRARPSCNCR